MKKPKKERYEFIGKSLYFPKEKILAIGDLHLGYEAMLRQQGVVIPLNMVKNMIAELDKLFKHLGETKRDVKKIVLLGDLKHYFSYNETELKEAHRMIEYLKTKVNEENLILIRGNHDTSKIGSRDFTDFYIFKDIAFVHGHKAFPEIFDKNINYIILGHIHPTITLSEKNGIKKEKYKCFLTGKFRGKKTVVLPSFFAITEGISMEDYVDHVSSIIPTKELKNFEVFVVSDSLKTLDFGKLRAL